MNNYFIKEGYRVNNVNITNDKVSGKKYWNKNRIESAEMYQFPVYKYATEHIKRHNISGLIDVGCGSGIKLNYIKTIIPNLQITGIDQENPINFCRKSYSFGKWLIDDFDSPNLSNSVKAEMVICSDVIEHMIDPDFLLDYLKKRTEKGGVILLSTPDRDILRGKKCTISPNKAHVREWNYKELEQYLEYSGFQIIEHFYQYPVKFGLNTVFFNEMIKRFLSRKKLKYNQIVLMKVK